MQCPECKNKGWKVLPLTVGAHVKEELWDKVNGEFFFCPSPDCDVIYYGTHVFRLGELKTRVGLKVKDEPKPVCYCNRVTERALIETAEKFGKEKALEITEAGKGGWCIVTNPSGRCCEWYLKKLGFQVESERGGAKGVELSGLTCMGCVSAVKAALESAGARVAEINLERAVVEIDGDPQKLIKAVKEAGYTAKIRRIAHHK